MNLEKDMMMDGTVLGNGMMMMKLVMEKNRTTQLNKSGNDEEISEEQKSEAS